MPAVLLRVGLTTWPGHSGQTSWRLPNRGGVSLESDFQRFCFRHRQPARAQGLGVLVFNVLFPSFWFVERLVRTVLQTCACASYVLDGLWMVLRCFERGRQLETGRLEIVVANRL